MRIKTAILFYVILSALGLLCHFAYGWIGADILKIFFPRNESIFEHLKLLVIPTIVIMIIDSIMYRAEGFQGYVFGLLVAMVFMVAAHYTVTGIVGYSIMAIDIIIFFASTFIIMYYRYKKITLGNMTASVIMLILIFAFVEYFTFYPIEIPFFLAPQL